MAAEAQTVLFGRKPARQSWLEFVERNPEVLREMEGYALRMQARLGRVSAKTVFEVQRAFGQARVADDPEHPHDYKLNNSWTPLFADWLVERHPEVRVERRVRSR